MLGYVEGDPAASPYLRLSDDVVLLRPIELSDIDSYVARQDAEMARRFEWPRRASTCLPNAPLRSSLGIRSCSESTLTTTARGLLPEPSGQNSLEQNSHETDTCWNDGRPRCLRVLVGVKHRGGRTRTASAENAGCAAARSLNRAGPVRGPVMRSRRTMGRQPESCCALSATIDLSLLPNSGSGEFGASAGASNPVPRSDPRSHISPDLGDAVGCHGVQHWTHE